MMKWLLAASRIVFYLIIGAALFICPWSASWSGNFFLAHYAWVSAIGHNDFVRGAISGIGLADIWLAIDEIHRSLRSTGPLPTLPLR